MKQTDETTEGAAREAFAPFGLTLPRQHDVEPVSLPLNHIFTRGTPGLCGSIYTREIFMPAGAWVFSHVHLTTHPFALLTGIVMVWSQEKGVETIAGGHLGITTPGTRRILYIVQDAVWATFHATESQDADAIERALVEPPTTSDGRL